MKKAEIIPLILVLILTIACSTFGGSTTKQVETQVAQTLEVMLSATIPPTATSVLNTPSLTPTTASTAQPTAPTVITIVSPVIPTVVPTVVTIPCNSASFVTDVTIPDGTEFKPNQSFNKVWRISNTGSCSWNHQYQLIYSSGDQMNAPSAVNFADTTAPGATKDIAIDLTSPGAAGNYTGYFKIKAPDGTVFGVGPYNSSLSAVISVTKPVAEVPGDTLAPPPPPPPMSTPTLPPPPAPKAPDLKISEFQINYGNPIKDKVPTHVRIGVYNQGTYPATEFGVAFWGLESFPNKSCTWTIDSLAAKGGRILECDFTYNSWYADGVKAKVEVDLLNQVGELDESNNILYPVLDFDH